MDLTTGVAKECAASPNGLRMRNAQKTQLGPKIGFGETFASSLQANLLGETSVRIDSVQVFEIESKAGDLGVIAVMSGDQLLTYEIFAEGAGSLPASVLLRPGEMLQWHWEGGDAALIGALERMTKEFASGINHVVSALQGTNWIEWGLMAVPLDEARFVLLQQSAPRMLSSGFGLDGFLAKLQELRSVLARLNLRGGHRPEFLRPSWSQGMLENLYPEMKERRLAAKKRQALEVARRLASAGQERRALQIVREALQAVPDDADLRALHDELQRKAGDAAAAQKDLDAALRTGDLDKAAAMYQEMIAGADRKKAKELQAKLDDINLKRVRKLMTAAQELQAQGKNAEAAAKLRAVLEINPKNPVAKQMLEKLS